MSATAEKPKQPKSEFMAAEEIKGILDDLDKGAQQRVLRWVGESLGLAGPPAIGGVHVPPRATPQPQASSAEAGQHEARSPVCTRTKDLKTFVLEKNPKSDVHFATVTAYFYLFEAPESDRKEGITAKDLKEATRLVNWDRFTEPYVPLQNATKQGYLDRTGGGVFRINAVGENLVAMTLPGTAGAGKGARRPKRRPRKAKPQR